MSDQANTRLRMRRAARRIRVALFLSVLGSAAFAWGYADGTHPQVLGVGLGVAFAGLAYTLSTWAKHLIPPGGHVEEHTGFTSGAHEQRLLVDSIAMPPSPLSRKRLLGYFGLAGGALGLAALFPLRSLIEPRISQPDHRLSTTGWAAGGLRLVDPDGRPIRLDDVTVQTISPVYPEGHVGEADAVAFVVRLDPARLTSPPPGGDIDGVVAYSLLCTHAGCSVALYEQGTGRVLCPCHQSAFNLFSHARPVAGPAGRPLPGLPIAVDAAGYLIATGDFTAPPGPGYWSIP